MIWHQNLDPYLLGPWKVYGQLIGVRWYSLPYILTFLVIYFALSRAARRREIPNASVERIEDTALLLLVAVMVGGRLGYFLFNQPQTLLSLQGWSEVLQVWRGGMAFFGAVLAAFLVEQWYCRKHKISFWHATDRVMWILAFGLGFGRICNYINSELIGLPTNGNWGVVFDALTMSHYVNGLNVPRHPVQLYSAATHFLLGLWLLYLLRRAPKTSFDRVPGYTCFWFLGGYGLLRFITDIWREEQIWVFPGYLNGSQALSLLLMLIAILGARVRFAILTERKQPCDWYPPEGIKAPLPDECHAYLDAQNGTAAAATTEAPRRPKAKRGKR